LLKIERIDHLVLTVSDIERTCDFYSRVLGMQSVVFDEGRRALAFGGQKINLHQAGEEFEPHAAHPTPGSADLCFITGVPTEGVLQKLESHGIGVVMGPVERTGALGPMESVYLRDPDGNLIEVSTYPV
jgi:catechol 2,3-dioxygenase-like lactoylglutathione lyase family enzyme